MTVNQFPERKPIEQVELAGGDPTTGPGVIDHLFPLTVEGAKPMRLHNDCLKQMHEGRGVTGKSNDESFQQCFRMGSYKIAEPQLQIAAYRHGELARIIQSMLVPGSTEVSLQAFEAAGAAVRKICTVSCSGALGQWCEWP